MPEVWTDGISEDLSGCDYIIDAVDMVTAKIELVLRAGFTEIGETLEETVSREVMEEVGLKVKNITYYKNQPWAFSDTLLMGFFCELDGSNQVKLDENELALAEWFERNQIPVEPDDISLTNEMMMVFRDGYTI